MPAVRRAISFVSLVSVEKLASQNRLGLPRLPCGSSLPWTVLRRRAACTALVRQSNWCSAFVRRGGRSLSYDHTTVRSHPAVQLGLQPRWERYLAQCSCPPGKTWFPENPGSDWLSWAACNLVTRSGAIKPSHPIVASGSPHGLMFEVSLLPRGKCAKGRQGALAS